MPQRRDHTSTPLRITLAIVSLVLATVGGFMLSQSAPLMEVGMIWLLALLQMYVAIFDVPEWLLE